MNSDVIVKQLAQADAYAPENELPTDARSQSAALTEIRRRIDMDTKEVRTKPEPEKPTRQGWLVAAASFALIIVIAGTGLWLSRSNDTGEAPASDVTGTTASSDAAAESKSQAMAADAEAAMLAFLEAREQFDVESASALVAANATIDIGPSDSKETMALEMQWTEASGLVVTEHQCHAVSPVESSAPVDVLCSASATSPIGQSLGSGPVTFTHEAQVLEGTIVAVALTDIGDYSSTIWEPFETWIRQRRGDQHANMYADFRGTEVLLTPQSIELWREYTEDFVLEQGHQDELAIAGAFMIGRQNRDVDRTVAALASGDVVDWFPGGDPDELAAGFAWEEAMGIDNTLQYCTVLGVTGDSEVSIQCVMGIDTAISSAIGDDGGTECVDVEVAEGTITSVTMGVPGPSMCSGFNFASRFFGPFNGWLASAHPEVSAGSMYDDRLSPEGLALWAQFADEFVAANTDG